LGQLLARGGSPTVTVMDSANPVAPDTKWFQVTGRTNDFWAIDIQTMGQDNIVNFITGRPHTFVIEGRAVGAPSVHLGSTDSPWVAALATGTVATDGRFTLTATLPWSEIVSPRTPGAAEDPPITHRRGFRFSTGQENTVDFNIYNIIIHSEDTMPQIGQTLEAAAAVAQAGVNAMSVSNATTAANIMAVVEGAITDSTISAAWHVAFNRVDATPDDEGSITGTIRLSRGGSYVDVTVNLTIPVVTGLPPFVGNPVPVNREVPAGATIVLGALPGGMATLIDANHFSAVAPAVFDATDDIVFVSNLNVDNTGGLVILPADSGLQPGDVVRGTGRTTLTPAFSNSRLEVAAIDGGGGSSVGLGAGLFGANYSIVSGNFAFTFILRESDIQSGLRISPNTWAEGGAGTRPADFAFSIDDMIVFRPLPPGGDWTEVFRMTDFIDYADITAGAAIPATATPATSVFARNGGFAGVQWVAGNPVDGIELSARVGPRTENWHDVRFDLDGLYNVMGIAVQAGDEITIVGRAVTEATTASWRRIDVGTSEIPIAAGFSGTFEFDVTFALTTTTGHIGVAGNGGTPAPAGIFYVYIDNIIIEGYRE